MATHCADEDGQKKTPGERERKKHGHPVSLRTRKTYRQNGCHVLEVAVVCEVLVALPVRLYHSLEPVTLQEGVTQCNT